LGAVPFGDYFRRLQVAMTAQHNYVDETKERGYVLVASAHVASEVDTLRKMLRARLVMRGQARIHMLRSVIAVAAK
jgi:hypothetical protein